MENARGAVPVWFGKGRSNDAQYLTLWQNAPLTYDPKQAVDHHWNVDRYEAILGRDTTGALFTQAASLVLHNRFYPEDVMQSVSDFGLENRAARPGDRVLQRIRIFQYNTLPILEVLALNEITEVIDEPRRAGFTYTTTSAHSEIGEWSPRVEWRENGEVALIVEVVSRIRPGAPALARHLARSLQLRAHQLGIENFRALVAGKKFRPAHERPASLGHLAPLGLFFAGLLYLIWKFSRRNHAG